jgi:hypothetical protein
MKYDRAIAEVYGRGPPRFPIVDRRTTQLLRRAPWGLALIPLVVALAGCGTGGGGGSAGSAGSAGSKAGTTASTTPQEADAALESSGKTVLSAMSAYQRAVNGCARQSSPVVCLEAADHTLGDKIHAYANLLARHEPFTAPRADVTRALNSAQTLANSLEILGDAQPTQANYNQVLSTYNINAAVTALQGAVSSLSSSLGR